jgi:hypothetical protein
MGVHSSKLSARCGATVIVYEGLVRIRSFVYAATRWLGRNGIRAVEEPHTSLLREVNVTMDGVLLCAGIAVLIMLRLRAHHHQRQLDRAYARARSELARRAKWSAFKIAVVAIVLVLLWVKSHA